MFFRFFTRVLMKVSSFRVQAVMANLKGFLAAVKRSKKGLDRRIPPLGAQRGHVQHATHLTASAPEISLPAPFAAIVERRHARRRRDLPPVELPQFGQARPQGEDRHLPHARHRLQPFHLLFPGFALPQPLVQIAFEAGNALVQPAYVLLDVPPGHQQDRRQPRA